MPKISDIENTPNPNARKFILEDPLSWGISHSYATATEAQNDPLAREIFAIPHVSNVFYLNHWLTVTQDGGAEWNDLLRKLAIPLRAAPAAEEQSAQLVAAASIIPTNPEDQERLIAIKKVLDEQIRPFLQSDGGDLEVISLIDNVLQVHYHGACGSCPSSLAGTLQAIMNLVATVDQDILVEAV